MKKKNQICKLFVFFIVAFFMLTSSCKKNDENNDPIDSGTVTDIDGNVYHTVKIGTQVWMVENLKTTKFNDGRVIPYVTVAAQWQNLTTSAYCWYNNNETANKDNFGALYNWYAVGTEKLCPPGWHVPSASEWSTLAMYLGGKEIVAAKLKETGTIFWDISMGVTNESGFNARGGGMRTVYGAFNNLLYAGNWWTKDFRPGGNGALDIQMTSLTNRLSEIYYSETTGFSVRCIKD